MPVLIHLVPESLAARVLARGLKAPAGRGLFCMPSLPSTPSLPGYYVSHQWLRELERRGARTFVAIDFRVPASAPARVGHYGQGHRETTVGRAIGELMRAPDPLGWELILDHAVPPRAILGVRAVGRVTGWRYYPGAKGKAPCRCDYCQRGEYNGKRIRERGSLNSG
jgi:hypothetical protein